MENRALLDYLRKVASPWQEAARSIAQDPVRALMPNPVEQVRQSAGQLHQALYGQPKPDYGRALVAALQGGASVGMTSSNPRAATSTVGEGPFYHGAARPIAKLVEGAEQGMNIYGSGLYTTNSIGKAFDYTRKGRFAYKRAGEGYQEYQPTVHAVGERVGVKLYDLDAPISAEAKAAMEAADGGAGSPLSEVLEQVGAGKIKTLGQALDEARAVSREYGYSASDVVELIDSVAYNLEKQGFGGFTHVGGKVTGTSPHRVNIYWKPWEQVEAQPKWSAPATPDPRVRAAGPPLYRR